MVSYIRHFLAILSVVWLVGIPSHTIAAEDMSLEWRPPTQQCDGSPATLSGFRIYYSKDQGRPTGSTSPGCNCPTRHTYQVMSSLVPANVTTAMVTVSQPGTYYVTMTAVGADGRESCYSNEVTKTVISTTPNAPLNFEISLGPTGIR